MARSMERRISTPQESSRAGSAPSALTAPREPLTGYHWIVIIVASAGWLFDCMDQRIFALSREPAVREILGGGSPDAVVRDGGAWATAVMIIGWATGGIIFGIMSDRLGRVKTMAATLLLYSGFTGLSGLADSMPVFLLYRFLVGLGIGGMFGAATTLVAESVPAWARALALGSLQALSATGNIIGSLVSTWIQPGKAEFMFGLSGWRVLFFVGAFLGIMTFTVVATTLGRRPAFLVAFVLCLASTIFVFNHLESGADAYWMLPLMGFAQLSVFGGYAIYFPELFPTRLRGTGVGFCYNTVRYLAAAFPPMLMFLNRHLIAHGVDEPFRKAATILSFVFLLGLVALIWAPETKGRPLPED